MSNHPYDEKTVAKFWERVIRGGPDECWIWVGSRHRSGYGQFTFRQGGIKKTMRAHRMSYELSKGQIKDGLEVCHNCPCGDNKSCVNPAHLYAGTHKENMMDTVLKGQWRPSGAVGERHGMHKIRISDVAAIRSEYTGMRGEQTRLAAKYGLGRNAISSILSRKTWKHVP